MVLRIALAFLALGLLLWSFFSYPLFMQAFHLNSYSASVPYTANQWSIQGINDELYRPVAHFDYTVDGKSYHKDEMFLGGYYRTPYAANQAVEELRNEHKQVWYDPKHPERATLEKHYPAKKLTYAFVALGLLLYGVWLLSYLTARYLKDHGWDETPQIPKSEKKKTTRKDLKGRVSSSEDHK